MTSNGGCDNCGRRHCRGRCSVSVPTHRPSAFSSKSSSCSYSNIRFKSRKKLRVYYLKAQLLPQKCRCVGTTQQCPFFVTPTFTTIPNSNLPSGYGKGEFTIYYDSVTKLGTLNFKISYAKLFSFGNLNPARIIGVEIRGPSARCNVPANIMVNALGIYLLATGGASADCYVTGSTILERDQVQQFLHNLCYVVIRTQQFSYLPQGEISGGICLEREERISRH